MVRHPLQEPPRHELHDVEREGRIAGMEVRELPLPDCRDAAGTKATDRQRPLLGGAEKGDLAKDLACAKLDPGLFKQHAAAFEVI